MNAKHQFKYTYTDTDIEEISPVDVTFDMPGDVNITQMLWNFECYLKACGFVFDGHLEVVDNGCDNFKDELNDTLQEVEDAEPQGGCMADWDDADKCFDDAHWEQEAHENLNANNEHLAKLNSEVKDQKQNELDQMNDNWDKLSDKQRRKLLKKALQKSGLPLEALDNTYTKTDCVGKEMERLQEVTKNHWVHGICNPASKDWKPTSNKYASVQDMLKDLSNMKFNL